VRIPLGHIWMRLCALFYNSLVPKRKTGVYMYK
jgi:hypothetical protein